ncbi:threonylcarbamoyl-AMP synthase [Altererythrobacter aurantiacus]|uniref:Threonylcarbamoyl-AMP synthase n=1 Tax=Parapontixanthobacter aurantiacus TaxID=1463599 RepID=A0A844ZG51_9SPHN|nr:L-threonylcarbamoyladenylate synthase [Parapontixanthobacter aurantiacus]MXO86825.1 threonylcarbamoyl-AMP synthase [Parapontixanthobacter aurantiacus]
MVGKNATEILAADAAGIAEAARRLALGGLVALPTETVYGLAARADAMAAVARIYEAKGRPSFNPLIVHVASLEQAETLALFDEAARILASRFWPGPLTMVLPLRDAAGLAPAVTAGLETVAIRVPAHPVMRAVLSEVDFPIAAPSANRSGFISPTSPEHVLASLNGRIDAILGGGECRQGLESTIVARVADGWRVLRPGPIDIGEKLRQTTFQDGEAITAPGQLAQHYAPGKPVRLNAEAPHADEFMIGFGSVAGDCTLSQKGDLTEAAAGLYACLHLATKSAKPRIAVAEVPEEGIGEAINDRLRRAAA